MNRNIRTQHNATISCSRLSPFTASSHSVRVRCLQARQITKLNRRGQQELSEHLHLIKVKIQMVPIQQKLKCSGVSVRFGCFCTLQMFLHLQLILYVSLRVYVRVSIAVQNYQLPVPRMRHILGANESTFLVKFLVRFH